MKHNIIIHKDLCIEFAEGTLFNQHSAGTKSLVAKLEGWMLEEGACLFIAFKNGTDEVPPTLMAFEPKEGIYYMDIPRAVICKNGNWQMCVYKKLDWDEETKTASAVEVGKAKTLYMSATVYDEEGHCITEYDVASAVNTILSCSELAGELNGQAQDARDGAVLAKESAENAQVAAETAKATAVHSAEEVAAQAEIAANNAVAAADSAADARAASVTARTAAGQAESHENNTREMLARAIKQASDAAASAQTAEEKARQAAELFATHSIKINAEFAEVEDLPALGNSQTIYFIPNGDTGANSFDEYVWVGSKSGYEKIGSTEADLSGYVLKNGSEMTGTLKTPKICVDKIARNSAETVLIEPKVEFYSGVNGKSSIRTEKEIITPKTSNGEGGPILISETQFNGSARFTATATFDGTSTFKNVKIESLYNSSVSADAIALKSSLRGDGCTDITDIDTLGVKYVDLGQPNGISDLKLYAYTQNKYERSGDGSGSHLVVRADSGVTVTGSEFNQSNEIKFNVLGKVLENGERVYSPNNPPPVDTTKVSKSGDTITGNLNVNANVKANAFCQNDSNKDYVEFLTGNGQSFKIKGYNREVYNLAQLFSEDQVRRAAWNSYGVVSFSREQKESVSLSGNSTGNYKLLCNVCVDSPSLLTVFGVETAQHGSLLLTLNQPLSDETWGNEKNNGANVLAKAEGEQGYWSRQYLCCTVLIPAISSVLIWARYMDKVRYTLQPIFKEN